MRPRSLEKEKAMVIDQLRTAVQMEKGGYISSGRIMNQLDHVVKALGQYMPSLVKSQTAEKLTSLGLKLNRVV